MRKRHAVLVVPAVLLLAAAGLWWPLDTTPLASHAQPLAGFDPALVRAFPDAPEPALMNGCHTNLLTHGHRTGRAVLLLHGLTNCPAQFDSLAEALWQGGANVYVPRLPRHGLEDRLTDALAGVTAAELCAAVDSAVDVARMLGDTLTVAGLSVGGTLAAWVASERSDVDRAVVIAPMIGVARAPGAWTTPVTRLALVLPNQFVWWDDQQREHLKGPAHVYPRFATRAVAATLQVGARVREQARRHAPGARELVVVTVGGDLAVDNALTAALVADWRAHGARVRTYEFAASLHVPHDMVDPEQVGANLAVSYPVLLDALVR